MRTKNPKKPARPKVAPPAELAADLAEHRGRFAVAYAAGMPSDFSIEWQRRIALDLAGAVEMVVVIELLTAKLRSKTRKGLRAQLVRWLDATRGEGHESPFSYRQWRGSTYPNHIKKARELEAAARDLGAL